MGTRIRIAHLINPVSSPAAPELSYAQPVTFESLRVARNNRGQDVDVDLLTAQFPEDRSVIPGYFRNTTDLTRSVADCGSFSRPKKLPLLRDLLDRLYNESDADYLMYTNVDIALQPHFYSEAALRIRTGLDALMINRRGIDNRFRSIHDLPAMYAEQGAPHPGFDCFIFSRSLYPKFQLEQVCVGIPFVEMVFSQNLFCHAARCRVFDKDRLTFHIGTEVFKRRDREYVAHNKREFWKAMKKLWPDLDSRKFPWGDRRALYRLVRWGLHPAIPIRLALLLEPRRWRTPR